MKASRAGHGKMSSMTSRADRRAMQRGGRQPRRAWLPAARLPVRRETRKSAVYSMPRGGVTYRIITDNQGSVRLVVNAETGEVMQRLDYDSFGRVLRDTTPDSSRSLFKADSTTPTQVSSNSAAAGTTPRPGGGSARTRSSSTAAGTSTPSAATTP